MGEYKAVVIMVVGALLCITSCTAHQDQMWSRRSAACFATWQTAIEHKDTATITALSISACR